ncbi:MAG: 50S ribosomal protein L6 [Candidatus Zixiibacteriota bacterium]
MSRVGKKPIEIPDKVKVEISNHTVTISGPKGSLVREVHPDMKVTLDNNALLVERPSDLKKHRALHGLTRALLYNMVVGVTEGFSKQLQIIGVGYRAEARGKNLVLHLGYSHPIVFSPPDDVSIAVEPKENRIDVSGTDKELVGLVAAKIRSFRKPEPYKGKGIRYVDEHIRIKAGKAAVGGAGG